MRAKGVYLKGCCDGKFKWPSLSENQSTGAKKE
jgi:hypothetical protein